MLDGTKTGLVSSRELAQELEEKQRQKLKRFEEMDPKLSGKAAQTVYRDRGTGKALTQDQLAEREREERESKSAKPMWSAGLAQKRQHLRERRRLAGVAEEEGGNIDDSDGNVDDKDRARFGDPMAHLVRKKKRGGDEEKGKKKRRRRKKRRSGDNGAGSGEEEEEESVDDGFYQQRFGVSLKELRASGYVIPSGVPPHSWIKRRLRAPVNRFGIKPGRFWDGVDRSNGFERDYFKEVNRQKHRDQQAFMWSQQDM
mmetsp:Transcript_11132/g.28175  ORF Transcript_11132/g.28175 Transcript_11132/m.28175 type:complete len:256 (-) Transcript_11132:970-1737(-)